MKDYWNELSDSEKESLAKSLKTSTDYLRQVFNGYRKVGAVRAIDIENATNGAVKKHELRPDIFDA